MAELKEKIETKNASLGKAQERDENAPQADFMITDDMLDARQAAIRRVRKYAGPESSEGLEAFSDELEEDVPPTECIDAPEDTLSGSGS